MTPDPRPDRLPPAIAAAQAAAVEHYTRRLAEVSDSLADLRLGTPEIAAALDAMHRLGAARRAERDLAAEPLPWGPHQQDPNPFRSADR